MNAIVSITRDWGIGREGKLLVRNREDMRRFVALTTGGTVVMGRKTFESLPGGPLKHRRNIVLTRDENWSAEGVEVVRGIDEALSLVAGVDPDTVWLIGGAMLYRSLIDCCRRAYVTRHDIVVEADAYFPNLDADERWQLVESNGAGTTAEGIAYEFVTYERMDDVASQAEGCDG